ncbi:MAG: hypothetical protein IT379_38250 [Deltaproteobacteria bacterium]|nr:hypothetical protein [Deltaproteobacteria bacterium]
MTEKKDDDLDWETALDEWDADRSREPGQALGENLRGGPAVGSGPAKSLDAASGRRLYRPPDEAEVARLRRSGIGQVPASLQQPITAAPPPGQQRDIDVLLTDDDEVTRFAPIPRELIDAVDSQPMAAPVPRPAAPPPPSVEVVAGATSALPSLFELDPSSGDVTRAVDMGEQIVPPPAQPKPSALVATDEELDLLLAEIDRLSGAPPPMDRAAPVADDEGNRPTKPPPAADASAHPTAPPRPLISPPRPAPAGRPSLDALRPRRAADGGPRSGAVDLHGPDTTDSVEIPAPSGAQQLPELTPSSPVALPPSASVGFDDDEPTGARLVPHTKAAPTPLPPTATDDEEEATLTRLEPAPTRAPTPAAPVPSPARAAPSDDESDEPEVAVTAAADDELDALLGHETFSQPPPAMATDADASSASHALLGTSPGERPSLEIDDTEHGTAAAAAAASAGARMSRPSLTTGDVHDTRAPRPAAGGARRPARRAGGDLGAEAARKVVSRRRRVEVLPLVGASEEVASRRVALYRKLAESTNDGPARARLLVAAARLLEGTLRRHDESMACYSDAIAADPKQVEAIRPLRRAAAASGRWGEVVELCEAELAADLAPAERVEVLLLLAEAAWHRMGDSERSKKALDEALSIEPGTPSALLLLAELHAAASDEKSTLVTLRRLANTTEDGALAAAILVDGARASELAGRVQEPRGLYREALERDPDAADAALGLARTSRHAVPPGPGSGPDAAEAIEALRKTAAMLGPGLGSIARYVAARWALAFGGDRAVALSELEQVGTPVALALRASSIAEARDELVPLHGALRGWADVARGTEKAVALVALAERLGDAGDVDGAEVVLAEARGADPTLATIRVVREAILRRAGATDRLTQVADELSGPLAAAAALARDRLAAEQELELLRRAVRDTTDPLVAQMLLSDASLEAGKLDGFVEATNAVANRVNDEPAAALRLVAADQLERAGDVAGAADAFLAASAAAPSTTRTARAVARTSPADARRAADAYRREADQLTTVRAAQALVEAGALLEASHGDEAIASYERALELAPTYVPALMARVRLARGAADGAALARLFDLAAGSLDEPSARAWRFRAALHASGVSPADGLARMRSLMEAEPRDATIADLVLRFSADLPPSDRAALHELRLETVTASLARAVALRAAAAHEEAGDGARAAALYRRLLGTADSAARGLPVDPKDPLAAAGLDRAEIRAGQSARVAERLMRVAGDDAAVPSARARAFEQLAGLDLRERSDRASAVLSYRSLLELVPGHVPTLRTLERLLLDQGRIDELGDVRVALTHAVSTAEDAAAYARAASRSLLAAPDAAGSAADDVVLAAFRKGATDSWTARRAAGAAEAAGDLATQAEARERLAAAVAPGPERATEQVRAADLRLAMGDSARALGLFREAISATEAKHLVALTTAAEILEQMGNVRDAAETCEIAARAHTVPAQSVLWWHRAGVIWQDRAGDNDHAIAALSRAAEIAPAFADTYERLRGLLEPRSQHGRLAELTRARIAAGAPPEQLLDLHEYLARIAEGMNDRATAKDAHRAALGIQPDRLDSLRALARLCTADQDWREAADALIRVARLSQDKPELRDVFFALGDIYDTRTPDVRRAEAAFKRVLAITPTDVPALERLAALYRRESRATDAIEAIARLCDVETDPEKRRGHRLELAEAYERAADLRQAEAALENARRDTPTDLVVVRALADFYGRQNAQTALAMHLDRAAADFRRQLESDPTHTDGYRGLAEVLSWRGRNDGARCVASAAAALGVVDPVLARLVDSAGGVPGAGSAAADTELNALLAPPVLTPSVREFFRLAEELLERMLPFDVRSIPGERVSLRGHPARAIIDQVARWFGFESVDVHVIRGLSAVCFATGSSPVVLISSADVLPVASEGELVFLLARAFKIAQGRLSLLMRAKPDDLAIAIAGIVRQYDPAYAVPGVDVAVLDDAARRAAKAMPRRIRDDLLPFALELGGARLFDAAGLASATTELADRVSLVAVGSVPASFGALARLSGRPVAELDPRGRVEVLRSVPMLQRLLRFAVDESCFEARHRTGANRR